MSSLPPKWPLRFLKWFCPPQLLEEIEGDLLYRYEKDKSQWGSRKANQRLWWSVIRFLRPGILMRNKLQPTHNPFGMWQQQLKYSTRILVKEKFSSVLNILGLSLGLSVSIILILFLQHDLTYDQHYSRHSNIYRLGSHYQITGVDEYLGLTARELAPILKDEFPEIQAITRLNRWGNSLVKSTRGSKKQSYYESRITQTDSSYFNLFDPVFLSGDAGSALSGLQHAVVTETTAHKYFGTSEVVGELLEIKGKLWTITAVIHDLPDNTHYQFDILLSGLPEVRESWHTTMKDGKPLSELFWNPDVETYLLLPNLYDTADFDSKFSKIYDLYFKETGATINGKNTPILERLDDIHLYSELQDGEPHGNIVFLRAFLGIGILITLLASINYMNLSTAKAARRATEIAVRKIAGSSRSMLILSTLAESLLLSVVSLLLALAMVYSILELSNFNDLIGKKLTLDLFANQVLLYEILLATLAIGLLSGLYPAFYLTAIPANTALKGLFKGSRSNQSLRQVLITVQFCISLFVVVCTLFMSRQLQFVMTKELGFDKSNMLVVPLRDSTGFKNYQLIKTELMKDSRIASITAASDMMGAGLGSGVMFGESESGMIQYGGILALFVGDDYLSTMGIDLVKGRDFQEGPTADVNGTYIINESAARLMGWAENPIGKKMTFWGGENPGEVIGVVKDFHVNSLYQGIDPMVIVKGHWNTGFLHIRLTGHDIAGAVQLAERQWRVHNESPFEYFFLDQKFNEQYKADVTQNKLLSLLSYVSIFISILGLIGLSAFVAVQRTKEIGIRKVLGAHVPDLILMLSRSTLLLVLVAAALIAPASWWVVTKWLETFVYRMPIDYTLYVLVTVSALAIVASVLSIQFVKTALSNPVTALKYE